MGFARNYPHAESDAPGGIGGFERCGVADVAHSCLRYGVVRLTLACCRIAMLQSDVAGNHTWATCR